MKLSYEITPEFYYGKDWTDKIPNGYKVVGFAPPRKGDFYLVTGTTKYPFVFCADKDLEIPHLILVQVIRKKTRHIFEETGEVREPFEEWALTSIKGVPQYYDAWEACEKKHILKYRVEEME